MPITETRMVFNKPTRKALLYEGDQSYSIIEKVISNEGS
jgi:hypothetical protein